MAIRQLIKTHDGIAFEFNARFPRQYFDKETGLHYNYHRYYDSLIGRYVTSDPIGLDGGLNSYGYVRNNPLTRIDPYGLFQVISGGYVPSNYSSFGDYMNARTAYMNSPAGQREKILLDYGASLQDLIKKCNKNKDYLQRKFDNWVVYVDPNINDPLNRHKTAADTSYSSQSTQFNFWFFNSSGGQALTFYHEFRHLMEENNKLMDNSLLSWQ